jgi:hypothetical protein
MLAVAVIGPSVVAFTLKVTIPLTVVPDRLTPAPTRLTVTPPTAGPTEKVTLVAVPAVTEIVVVDMVNGCGKGLLTVVLFPVATMVDNGTAKATAVNIVIPTRIALIVLIKKLILRSYLLFTIFFPLNHLKSDIENEMLFSSLVSF